MSRHPVLSLERDTMTCVVLVLANFVARGGGVPLVLL